MPSFFLLKCQRNSRHIWLTPAEKNDGRHRGSTWLETIGCLGVVVVLKTAHNQRSPTIFLRKGPSSLQNNKNKQHIAICLLLSNIMAIFLQNAFRKENGLFFVDFLFWKRWMATLAIVFCTSFWWRKVEVSESSGTKNHFQPRKPRSSTLPETIHSKKFQKIGPNPQGKPKKYSNHPLSGALAFWIFSFRKFLWPFWYLFVPFSLPLTKGIFPVFFCRFREDILFWKTNIWCIH